MEDPNKLSELLRGIFDAEIGSVENSSGESIDTKSEPDEDAIELSEEILARQQRIVEEATRQMASGNVIAQSSPEPLEDEPQPQPLIFQRRAPESSNVVSEEPREVARDVPREVEEVSISSEEQGPTDDEIRLQEEAAKRLKKEQEALSALDNMKRLGIL